MIKDDKRERRRVTVVSLLHRLSSGAHRLSAVELDDMLERKTGTQIDQRYYQLGEEINITSAQQHA